MGQNENDGGALDDDSIAEARRVQNFMDDIPLDVNQDSPNDDEEDDFESLCALPFANTPLGY